MSAVRRRTRGRTARVSETEEPVTTDWPYRLLVETMQQSALVLGDDGIVLFTNGRLGELLGLPEDQVIGRAFASLVAPPHQGAFKALLGTATRPGQANLDLLHADGSMVPASLVLNRLLLGTRAALSLIITDLTSDRELAQLERAHRESRASVYQLKETDRRKDDFLAEVAQELRNPLGPVRNVLEVLRLKGAATPELEWAQSTIERQVARMSRLLDELIDLSGIAQDRIVLQRQPVDLGVIIRAALEGARPVMEEWGYEVVLDLPDEPVHLSADPARLEQVFSNLLSNAANFTSRFGRIEVSAKSSKDMVEVAVRDNGAGIPYEVMPHIFEMFARVDRSIRGEQTSLGIGLALVRRLVELHGGTVEARSEGAGKGSEFIVRLPLQAGVPAEADTPSVESPGPLRILVVDDSQDNADALGALLRLQGNDVRVAYSGDAALEVGPAFEPNVVLLDLTMPGVDGLETCRQIRRAEWGDAAHVIAVTGRSRSDDRARTSDSGFDYHLTKPLDPAALTTLLGSLSKRRTPWPDKARRR